MIEVGRAPMASTDTDNSSCCKRWTNLRCDVRTAGPAAPRRSLWVA